MPKDTARALIGLLAVLIPFILIVLAGMYIAADTFLF